MEKPDLEDAKSEPSPEWFMPTVEDAISQWRFAHSRFLHRPRFYSSDEFYAATSLLFVAFLDEDVEEPWAVAAFEALRRELTDCDSHEFSS